MKVAITGSTGLVGTALARQLERSGHDVVRVVRGEPSDPRAMWSPKDNWIREGAFDGVDAVVNLSGASIGEGRWNESRKRLLRTSRVDLTRLLVEHLASLDPRPRVLVNASGVGYYGDGGDRVLDEEEPNGQGFLAELVRDWEAEAARARESGLRVAIMRSGVVLSTRSGALKQMLLPFKLGVGGRVASGKQWFPWITPDDAARGYVFALEHDLDGAANLSAPEPVTNRAFTKALGGALRRPTIFPIPAFALRVLYGEAIDELLLVSQRAVPARLQSMGFTFEQPNIDQALRHVLSSKV